MRLRVTSKEFLSKPNGAGRGLSGSGGLKLSRTDWRALQWTESDASEPVQVEFPSVF